MKTESIVKINLPNKKIKRLTGILLLLCLALAAVSCKGSGEERSHVLKIYNWADYIDEDVLAEFPDWYKQQTGEDIRLVYQVFDINELMLTKIERGHEDFDVVCPSEYIIERMLKKDLLLPIDRSFGKTPDYLPNISPYIRRELNKTSQPGRTTTDYAVPYMWGTAGILYNRSFITPDEAGSWHCLWNSKNKGKLLMKDSYRDAYGTAIIYARNRRRTKQITELLHNEDITADFYHAGLDDATKAIRQQRWQTGESRVMVATNAFGMGIDKPDVRIVIHMDLPDSIEAYFQEAGRAGRDGQKAYAVVLYAKSDKATLHKRIPGTFPEKEYIKEVYEHLQYYYQMAMGDGQGCVREFNIEDFCRKFKYFPVPVDSALKILTQAGYLEYTDEQDNASRLLFTIRRDELYKLRELGEDMDKLIQTILRSYSGVFTDHAFINEDSLAIRTGLTRRQVYEQLIHLAKLHIVSYIPRKKTPYIIYTRERVEMRHLQIPSTVYEERKERYEKRISAMLDYVSSDTVCRSRMLLHYFGEKNEHNCGQCDTCINLKNKKPSGHLSEKELSEKILQALSDKRQTPATLAEQIADDKNMLIDVLHGLLDEDKVIAVNGMLQIKK